MNQQTDSDLLVGWREIADYCRVSIDTVKRWHKRLELPIVRVGKSPMVFKDTLKQWIVEIEKIIHQCPP